MAIIVKTPDPQTLLNEIKKKIKDRKIETWSLNSEGYFIHDTSTDQWKHKAKFEAKVNLDKKELRFYIRAYNGSDSVLGNAVYGVYHGRFIQMLLNHFSSKFLVVAATANSLTGNEGSKTLSWQ